MIIWVMVLAGAALIAAMCLGWWGRGLLGRLEALEQVEKRRRLPYPAMTGLEDAIAVGDYAQFEILMDDKAMEALVSMLVRSEAGRARNDRRFAQMIEILRIIRSDAHAYDPDRPSGAKSKGE